MGGDTRSLQKDGAARGTHTTADFDLMTWQGLAAVLAVAKQAAMPEDAYNHFRDLVLSYAQNGGDKHTKKEIDAILTTLPTTTASATDKTEKAATQKTEKIDTPKHAQKASQKKEEKVSPKAPAQQSPQKKVLGKRRPTPQFAPVSVTKKPETKVEKTATPKAVVETPSPSKEHATPAAPPQARTKAPAVGKKNMPQKKLSPQASTPPPVDAAPSMAEQSVPPTPTAPPAPATPHAASPDATTAALKTPEEHKVRIAEIKRLVNSQFGNPITLIDQGNPIGREYMHALLAAMKATGGGGTITTAMEKLEAAYTTLLESGAAVATATQTPPASAPAPAAKVPEAAPAPKTDFMPKSVTHTDTPPAESSAPEPAPAAVPTPPAPTPATPPATNTAAAAAKSKPKGIPSLADALDTTPLAHVADMVTPEVEPEPEEPEEVPAEVQSIPVQTAEDISDIKETVSGLTDDTASEVRAVLRKEYTDLEAKRAAHAKKQETNDTPAATPTPPQQPAPAPKADTPAAATPEPPTTPPTAASTDDTPPATQHPHVTSVGPVTVPKEATEDAPDTTTPAVSDQGIPHIEAVPPHIHSGTTVTSTREREQSKNDIFAMTKTAQTNQSELASPAVTAGLGQLLDEWEHFKQSGMFGTGPSGIDHPLYKKLQTRAMAEVLAGRWEGADQSVIRSIKDYVNAWRHEQGVAYDTNETFEHYLRRVVQRILRRQQ